MLPPPITTATSTFSETQTRIRSAAFSTASMSMPWPPGAQSDSPLSLSSTRLKGPSPFFLAAFFAGSDTDLEPFEPHDLGGRPERAGLLFDQLADRQVRVLHERLAEERALGDELVDLPGAHLLDDGRRLAALGGALHEDLLLGRDGGRGHAAAVDQQGRRLERDDVH